MLQPSYRITISNQVKIRGENFDLRWGPTGGKNAGYHA